MYKIGEIVEGLVTGIQGYGAFVDLENGTGLVHISEISDDFVRNISDFLEIGKKYTFYIIDIDNESNHYKLSYKKIHNDSKNRYVTRSTKILNSNEKYFNDTYKEVSKHIKNLDNTYFNVQLKSINLFDYKALDLNSIDFYVYPNNILEKDTLTIKEIKHTADEKLVIVSNYEHFDLYNAYLEYLDIDKNNLIYLYNKSSIGNLEIMLNKLNNLTYKVLIILDDIFNEQEATIFRLLRKDLESKDIDPLNNIYICGKDHDEDLMDLVNKEKFNMFIEPSFDSRYSLINPSSLFVLNYLGVDIFDLIQGYRKGLIDNADSLFYIDILNKCNDGKFEIRSNKLYKLLHYYESYIEKEILFDIAYNSKITLPKYKDHLKILNGKDGKYINDSYSPNSNIIRLKKCDEFGLGYLISLIYCLTLYK